MSDKNFKDLLIDKGIDPQRVLVLRHAPRREPRLNKALPWLAANKPDVFNGYQRVQTKKVERMMMRAEYVASFLGREPKKALFVGLYSNEGRRRISRKQFWQIPFNKELKKLGMEEGPSRSSMLLFDLALTDVYAPWKGKLVIGWPPREKNWHRWASKPNNEMPFLKILEVSALAK